RARLLHAALHPGVLLVRECLVERGKCRRVMRLEHGFGRLPACRGVWGEKLQTAQCGVDGDADGVVDADRLQPACENIGRSLAGGSIDEPALILFDEKNM